MRDIPDGTSNTIAIVERKTTVCWMDPSQEISQREAENEINKATDGIDAEHQGDANFALFDGSVEFFPERFFLKRQLPVAAVLMPLLGSTLIPRKIIHALERLLKLAA